MKGIRWSLWAVVSTASMTLAAEGRAACPTSILSTCCAYKETTEPRDTVVTPPFCCYGSAGGAAYDLIVGALRAGGGGGLEGGGGARAIVSDEYRVIGLPEGPVTFFADLHVVGTFYLWPSCGTVFVPGGEIKASLLEGLSNEASASVSTETVCNESYCCVLPASLDTTLRITISRLAGETFRLKFDLDARAWGGSASSTGELSFADLPPGASTISCQGFTQGPPVPVLPTTWGRVKASYR